MVGWVSQFILRSFTCSRRECLGLVEQATIALYTRLWLDRTPARPPAVNHALGQTNLSTYGLLDVDDVLPVNRCQVIIVTALKKQSTNRNQWLGVTHNQITCSWRNVVSARIWTVKQRFFC